MATGTSASTKPALQHQEVVGRTYGDAIVKGIEFAREEPATFVMVTVPLVLVAILAYFVFVRGPIKASFDAFTEKRTGARGGKGSGRK